ncbi:MAG TPA: hypothetical protein VGM18_13645 [Candidatus Sulfotelmatobacter sp.]|jgi:hypothetical protein
MSVPLRKEEPEFDEEITTGDLAHGKQSDDDAPRPVLSRRPANEIAPDVENSPKNVRTGIRKMDIPDNDRGIDIRDDARNEISAETNNTINGDASAPTPLFANNELEQLRTRWSTVQTAFVDEPRRAVEEADGLVASAMKRLAEVFAEERSKLEQQWDKGDVSTEDLRIALQRYRSFFQRLLAV